MARVVVASSADGDAAAIINDLVEKAGYAVAARYVEMFDALYDRLAAHPSSGAPRPALGAQVRIGIVPPFIVIYDYDAPTEIVTVLRIVHGRRRISGQLLVRTTAAPRS
jgi:toxin ParE1/3/4